MVIQERKRRSPFSIVCWAVCVLATALFIACNSSNSSQVYNESNAGGNAEIEADSTTSEAEHEHVWTEATCTMPRTCSSCGETEGEALDHTWTEATCTETKTCSSCGETEGKALGHSWIEATCTEPKTCSVCGTTDGEALGHLVETWSTEKEASCVEEGMEKGLCSVCGMEQTRSIAMLEHDFSDWKVEKKATCTEKGSEKRTCKNCKKEETRDIAMIAHTEGEWKIIKEATYSETGVRAISCKVCGKELKRDPYSLSEDEKIAWLKRNCSAGTYNDLARKPNENVGKYVKFTCRVLQVVSEAESSQYYSTYRVATKGRWDDIIYLCVDNYGTGSRILEDDKITIYGIFDGLMSYTTVRGDTVTIPEVIALHYEY